MQLIEPQRWVDLLQTMNSRVSSSQNIFHITSALADVVVFLFPLFLVIVYVAGMKKRSDTLREYALRIMSSAVVAAVINIWLQFFIQKARPETVLEWAQRLVLKHLPTMSFPSDHAAVGMAFGLAVYSFSALFLLKNTKKTFSYRWVFFIIAWVVMSLARVGVGIHWPTDILAGWLVWVLATLIVHYIPSQFYTRIIWLEKKIFGIFSKN